MEYRVSGVTSYETSDELLRLFFVMTPHNGGSL